MFLALQSLLEGFFAGWALKDRDLVVGRDKQCGLGTGSLRCFPQSGEHSSLTAWSSLSSMSVDCPRKRVGSRTFKLAFTERWSVGSNDDELSFARAQSLESRFVAQCDC